MAVRSRLLAVPLLVALLLFVGQSLALGLGDIRVNSSLHQPFVAIIPVSDTAQLQPHELQVRLADQAAFQRLGMPRDAVLDQLRFEARRAGGQLQIHVSSREAIREPYLSFLLEVRGAGSMLMREFNVLLDPPLYQPRAITRDAQIRPQLQSAAQSQVEGDATGQQAQAPRETAILQPAPGALTYITQSGDTLWTIANRFNPHSSIPVARVIQGIYQLNPHAFVRGDINRLRVGQTLVVPTAEQLGVNLQLRAPDRPQQPEPLAEDSPPAAPAPTPVQIQDDRLRIDEGNAEPVYYQEQLDHLKALEARFNLMLDELEEKDRQVAVLQSRLAEVRRNRGLDSVAPVPTETAEQPAEPAVVPAIDAQAEVDAAESPEAAPTPAWLNWWPALLALLAGLLAVLLVRERRTGSPADEELPEPVLAARVPLPPVSPLPVKLRLSAELSEEHSKPDPLDGVELYLAYGRYAEGRDMLEAAIEEEPQRLDLRFKLLRVLGELQEFESFESAEQQLRELGADPLRLKAIRARFPELSTDESLSVEPILDAQQEAALLADDASRAGSLQDFSNRPNLDLFADDSAADKPKP